MYMYLQTLYFLLCKIVPTKSHCFLLVWVSVIAVGWIRISARHVVCWGCFMTFEVTVPLDAVAHAAQLNPIMQSSCLEACQSQCHLAGVSVIDAYISYRMQSMYGNEAAVQIQSAHEL